MELKRASLVLNTPPVTPRNSLLISSSAVAGNNSGQLFDIQEFLNQFDSEDSGQGVIPEVEETESEQHFQNQPAPELQPSQQAASASLPDETDSQTTTPVRLEPGGVEINTNNNNSNNNNNSEATVVDPGSDVGGETEGLAASTPISTNGEQPTTISWGNASVISTTSYSSQAEKRTVRVITSAGTDVVYPMPSPLSTHRVNIRVEDEGGSRLQAQESPRTMSKSRSSETLKQEAKGKGKGRSARLSKKVFHRSSEDILDSDLQDKKRRGKPPLVQRRPHKSSSDLREQKDRGRRNLAVEGRTRAGSTGARSSLSGLTDLSQTGEVKISSVGGKTKKNPKRLSLPTWGFRASPLITPKSPRAPQESDVFQPPSSPPCDDDSVWRDFGKI